VHVIVCGKVIPDTTVPLQIDPKTKRVIRSGIGHELDPAAAGAVEEALRITDAHGGEVTFITMGIADATIGIRKAYAMGVANGLHLLDDAFAGSDTLGTAKALAAAIKRSPFDLVICGTESSDSYSGIVAVQIAILLGIPALTFAKAVSVEGNSVRIQRQSETGYSVVTAELPALISVTSGINEPRFPPLKGVMAARKMPIETLSASDLGLAGAVGESAARERVLTVGAPPARTAGEVIEDGGEGGKRIADLLAARGLI
jgi:electron transfer flavoprotein beta subunit